MKVRLSIEERFYNGMNSLPPSRQKAVRAALLKFMEEPSTPSLRFRVLRGARDHFIINPHKGDRIILRRDEDDLYAVVDVGPHDNVLRRWDR